ncbi:MAG: hypothetical protein AAF614_13575 [Chloroflexota bacterium]
MSKNHDRLHGRITPFWLLALFLLRACGKETAVSPAAPDVNTNVRNARYCEILTIDRQLAKVEVNVYPTFGVNDCPAEVWGKMDADALAEELGITAVSLNGPRYFLMDALTSFAPGGDIVTIGGLDMRLAAKIELSLSEMAANSEAESGPYTVAPVQRNTEYIFDSGTLVYELISPEGDVYVMQSYSHIVDDDLTIEALSTLDQRLSPPAGWRYQARELDEPLHLRADGLAHVLQDELTNSYQLVTP